MVIVLNYVFFISTFSINHLLYHEFVYLFFEVINNGKATDFIKTIVKHSGRSWQNFQHTILTYAFQSLSGEESGNRDTFLWTDDGFNNIWVNGGFCCMIFCTFDPGYDRGINPISGGKGKYSWYLLNSPAMMLFMSIVITEE